jgi:Uma2 family endonuclease
MSQVQKIHRYIVSEYLALKHNGEIPPEYLDGETVTMGGASHVHNTLVFNFATAIRPHLRGTSCRIGGGDIKVFIAIASRA